MDRWLELPACRICTRWAESELDRLGLTEDYAACLSQLPYDGSFRLKQVFEVKLRTTVVGMPSTVKMSLIATGTPISGPRSVPAASRLSTARADRSADSAATC
jgi:hypothetical protein